MYLYIGFISKIKQKLLFILFNFFLLHSAYSGDIKQILPNDSNFTIDGNGSLEVMRVQSNGLVGIGTTTPHEKLEVNGHIRMTDGNEAANSVMIGNTAGTASWAPISTIQDGIGTDDQNLQLTGSILGIESGNNIDLNTTFATDAELAALNVDDNDSDPTNELITATDFNGTHMTITDAGATHIINLTSLVNQNTNLAPYIANTTINLPVLSTQIVTLTGSNFMSTSAVSIPGFDGTINSTYVISPTKIELNITTVGVNTFDIVVSNGGILNTQWTGNGVGLLQVSNSNGQSQGAAGLTCKALLVNGFSVGDGLYWIDPNGGSTADAFKVYCNMTADGGGWTLVFRHDVSGGYFSNDAEADSVNQANPGLGTQKYSILNKIDSIKSAPVYEFRLYYPDQNIRNHWTQTFDPRSGPSPTNPVAGYTAIAIDSSGSLWGGLEKSTSTNTFLDGSVNHSYWWYAIGTHSAYGGGMPGPSVVVQKVELYIR